MSKAMNNILLQPQNATSSHEVRQEDSFPHHVCFLITSLKLILIYTLSKNTTLHSRIKQLLSSANTTYLLLSVYVLGYVTSVGH